MKEINYSEIDKNLIDMISKQWMLITAGDVNDCNTMTASWGMAGFIWRKPMVNIFVRPSRHTFGYVENNEYFTLSFLPEEYRKQLTMLGTVSGRDGDKIAESGLTKADFDGVCGFLESDYVILCRKVYSYDITLDKFLCKDTAKVYDTDDIHRGYYGEIVKVFKR